MAHHLSNGAHRPSRLRRRAALVMLPVLLPLLAIATPAPMAQAQPPPPTVTFEYTGAVQQWTVPSNVRLAEFAVYGAQGGSDWGSGGAGGRGGQVVATFPVAPGDTIFLYVGGKGGDSSTGPISCGTGAGGFNGGGRGGNYVANPGLCNGAGGGGASDVRVGGAALTKRVLVAGGRGAGTIPACAAGGAGGGLVGGNGACFDNGNVTGGGGGGQSSSGLGCPCIPAGNGDLGTGGVGANANQGGDIRDGNGAGGGSGYHGGGGGRVNPPDVFGNGGAGGGGSGHGPANTAFQSSVQEGQGRIVITYYVLDPPQVLGITSNAGSEKGGTSVTITGANFTTPDGVVPTVPTTVTFGDTPASSVSCTSSECTAVSPPGSLGTVSVRATLAGQISADTPADNFTYLAGGPTPTPPPFPTLVPTAVPSSDGTAQLAALETAVSGMGPTNSLGHLVRAARVQVAAGRDLAACGLLEGFQTQVQFYGRFGQITPVAAQQFVAEATAIRTRLGCS